MNTKKIVGVIAGILLVGGGVSIFTQSSSTVGNNNVSENNTEVVSESMTASALPVPSDSPSRVSGSVEDLLALGRDVTCTFEQQNQQGTVNGEVYVSGSRLRSNFALSSGQGNFEGSMIRDGEYVYTWGNTPYGQFASKIAFTEFNEENIESQLPVNITDNLDYDCSDWNANDRLFVVPADVDFVEINSGLFMDADLLSAGM